MVKQILRRLGILIIGISNLNIIWDLGLEIWDFSFASGKSNWIFFNKLDLNFDDANAVFFA